MNPVPSAWSQSAETARFWQRLRAARRSILMLDYDGTLAPFKNDRLEARPYPGVEERLAALAHLPSVRLVLVSGRPARELQQLLGPATRFEIWGNHGWEHLKADGSYRFLPLDRRERKAVERVKREIAKLGLSEALEEKPASLAIHWRMFEAAEQKHVHSVVKSLYAQLAGESELQLLPFDGGLELRSEKRTKGAAVGDILAEEEAGLPAAYLGDDRTDEDAFAIVGDRGLSVLVRAEARASLAQLWIKPPEELFEFLDRWVQASSEGGRAVTAKSRGLIIVSNRIPITFSGRDGDLTEQPSNGGLVSALEPLLRNHGGTWVGSPGGGDSLKIHRLLEEGARERSYKYEPVFLSEEENHNFYKGFSNEVIWPLFHDLQSRCNFDPAYWRFYQRVNRKFASAVERISHRDDLIWIHDYQLMQVGKTLRAHRPEARLAYFLHIPFPPPDIFEKLPWRREILEGLLEHDLIGMQTRRDERNFIACLRSFVRSVKITGRGESHIVVSERRQTHIQFFPISINYRDFAETAASAPILRRVREIKAQLPFRLALGVDRLDYTKGIPERLKAFRSLLRNHPEFRRQVQLIQIVVPSREGIPKYQDLKSEVERLVAQINGEFGEPGWIPINYMHRSIDRDELIAIYRAADVAVVTPLKDGMNLVAKEYCATRVETDGVLVLSEFAGAASELRNGAILVNPNDEHGVAAALKQALEMPADERHRRMLRLRNQIRHSDVLKWRDRFFAAIEHTPAAT